MYSKSLEGRVAGHAHKTNTLFIVLIFLVISSLAEAQTQGHPFSQIYYIDANINMSGFNITNVSYLGIGTIAPAYPLDVAGTGRITNNLSVGGRLGIGTLSPQNALNVIGDINATGTIYGTLGQDTVNTTNIVDSAVTDAKISEMNWTKLQNYPSACGSDEVVQGINDTLACVNMSAFFELVGNVSGSGNFNYIPLWVGAGIIGDSYLYQSSGLIYTTSGVVLGGNINMQNSYSLINATYVNATNIYAGGNAVLTTATAFGGNVSGNQGNLQLGSGSVGTNQLIDGSITSSKISPDLNLGWKNLTDYPQTCAAGEVVTGFGDTLNCTTAGLGNITGGGDANYVAKFTGSTPIGKSIIYDNGTGVGINVTTDLVDPFQVQANLAGRAIGLIGSASNGVSILTFMNNAKTASLSVQSNGTVLGITGGNVGFGTNTPQSSLEVAGTFNASSNNGTLLLNSEGDVKVGV